MATKKKAAEQPDMLTSAAQVIGATLGKLAVAAGIEHGAPPAAKKKAATKKTAPAKKTTAPKTKVPMVKKAVTAPKGKKSAKKKASR